MHTHVIYIYYIHTHACTCVFVQIYTHTHTYIYILIYHCPSCLYLDDGCFYYHSWRIYVVIAFGTLVFSYLASMSSVVGVVCPFADDEKLKKNHVDLALLVLGPNPFGTHAPLPP